jgi:hypothetical protein
VAAWGETLVREEFGLSETAFPTSDTRGSFDPGVTGTIALTSGVLGIDKTLTIQGPGASTTRVPRRRRSWSGRPV